MSTSTAIITGRQGTFETCRFVGIEFARFNNQALLHDLRERADRSEFCYVVTPNTDHVVTLSKLDATDLGPVAREAYASAHLCLCDSRVLARLALLSRIRLDVLAGSDLTELLFTQQVVRPGDRIAMIGGEPAYVESLRTRYPQVEFLAHFPPMGVLRNALAQDEIVAFVEHAKANFVFFAIGAPQSELLAWKLKQRGKATGVALCVGASIEFLTGAKRRAPLWIQQLSLEWLFRLASEPRRLWRRYILDGPRILAIWWHDRDENRGR